jgi:hypothetical protein
MCARKGFKPSSVVSAAFSVDSTSVPLTSLPAHPINNKDAKASVNSFFLIFSLLFYYA